jgi:hypothetical protein
VSGNNEFINYRDDGTDLTPPLLWLQLAADTVAQAQQQQQQGLVLKHAVSPGVCATQAACFSAQALRLVIDKRSWLWYEHTQQALLQTTCRCCCSLHHCCAS